MWISPSWPWLVAGPALAYTTSVKPGSNVVPFFYACIKLNSFIIQKTIKCQVQTMCRKVGQISLVSPRVQQNADQHGIFVPNILPADTWYLSRQVSSPQCGESFFLCCLFCGRRRYEGHFYLPDTLSSCKIELAKLAFWTGQMMCSYVLESVA